MTNIKLARKAAILAFAISTVLTSVGCADDPPATTDPVQPTSAAQVQPASADHVMVTPAELTWADAPSLPPGAKVTLIEGQVDQPVPFTLRLQFPAGYQLPAHRHPGIEHVTVLSGAINMGRGDTLDKAKTTALPTGSLVIMPSNTNHSCGPQKRRPCRCTASGLSSSPTRIRPTTRERSDWPAPVVRGNARVVVRRS